MMAARARATIPLSSMKHHPPPNPPLLSSAYKMGATPPLQPTVCTHVSGELGKKPIKHGPFRVFQLSAPSANHLFLSGFFETCESRSLLQPRLQRAHE